MENHFITEVEKHDYVKSSIKHYPKFDRGHFFPNPHEDLAWAEGRLQNGRPFLIEYWLYPYTSLLTIFMSTLDLEYSSEQELKDMLIEEGLIEFDDDNYHNFCSDGINLTAKKCQDASNNEMWALTLIVGDEDGTYVHDKIPLKKYLFPDKNMDPYLYTKKGTDIESAEYFIALCEEQSEQETGSMYQGYFINNTSAPIEIMLEVSGGALRISKSRSTINDLLNNPAIQKSIVRYENIPAQGYVRLYWRYFDWEFDWPISLHLFLKTAGVEKHVNFYMEKYFIARKEIDCIPALNKCGYVCLPPVYG